MINNTDIFTRLDWLTNKVNRILGALQNGGGGGGAQNINQVLATGSTATNKTLLFNDTAGLGTTGQLSSTQLRFINTDDAVSSTITAGGINLLSGNNLEITADIGIVLQGAGGLGSLFLNIEPNLFEVTRVLGGSTEVGLSANFNSNVFGFGDTNSSAGLFISASTDHYQLGNFVSGIKGINLNVGTGEYYFGSNGGCFLHIVNADADIGYIVTGFKPGTESGLGLFNNTGHYKLGDFGATAQPDTYGVYLDVSSSKSDSSIKSYHEGSNKGLYIDHNASIYGFRNEANQNGYFGLGASTLTGFPSLAMANGMTVGGTFTLHSFIPINIAGTMFYIPIHN